MPSLQLRYDPEETQDIQTRIKEVEAAFLGLPDSIRDDAVLAYDPWTGALRFHAKNTEQFIVEEFG